MAPAWSRRNKLLFGREIGGYPVSVCFGKSCFEKQMLTSQVFGNKHLLRPPYYQKDILGHFGCVNAVEFSSNEELLASGGDDKRVLVWNASDLFTLTTKPKAETMKGKHESNIFCLAFTSDTQRLLSSGNDHTVIVHDLATGNSLDVYMLEEAVYSISVHPDTDRIFVTACEDGRVQLWDQRLPSTADAVNIASHSAAFQCAAFNPIEGRLIATANSRDGVQLWDVRRPKWCVMRYNVGQSHSRGTDVRCQRASCMCVRWDSRGERILALRRRMMPVLFHVGNTRPMAYFDHPGYYNSCTMKSCCFAGMDDEYAVSGSDNFNIYMWPTPPASSAIGYETEKEPTPLSMDGVAWELKGHRSIVNQVRYSRIHQMLASSGVEKVIKLWSPWPMPGGRGCGQPRPLYTHQEYLNMVIRDGGLPAGQDEQESRGALDEDPRMMAFFDSLVLREMEDSSSSDDSSDESFAERTVRFLADGDEASSSQDGDRPRRWQTRYRRRIFLIRELEAGRYNNEIVESESSSSSDSSTSMSTVGRWTDRWNATFDSDSNADDIVTMSDPEEERRHIALESNVDAVNGGPRGDQETSNLPEFHDHLDPALGYLPNLRLSTERDVTRLVMRKRRLAQAASEKMAQRKRRRTLSDPVQETRTTDGNNKRRNNEEGTISGEEVRRRVEAAVAVSRRGHADIALRRLVQDDERDSSSNIEGGIQNTSIFSLNTSASSEDEGTSSTSVPSGERSGTGRRIVKSPQKPVENERGDPSSSSEAFRKRQRELQENQADTMNGGRGAAKRRHYRRHRHHAASSESSDDEDVMTSIASVRSVGSRQCGGMWSG